MDRFWKGFWRGFGEVFGDNFDIILIFFLYYSAYRVVKDLGRDLEVILIVFGWFLDCFFNDLGGHIGMILLLLFILFQYSFQMMRSLCQGECEADVKINAKPMRSRCQDYCEAYVKKNATPMSRYFVVEAYSA